MHKQRPEGMTGYQANQPFAKLQKILDKQKARPLRTSPPKVEGVNLVERGLVLNRKKVENLENTVKRMYPERGIATGYTWEDMIHRTSDEKFINMKVNISKARALAPDTKRCVNPELNSEIEKVKPVQVPVTKAEKLRHGNENLIAGDSVSSIDQRVKNKQRWKVGLINKFENNQDMWGDMTNSFVNKLKEEVQYDPAKDFKKENEMVNERLARKLEIMQEQCAKHKENMQQNPITGQRSDSQTISRRRQSQFGQVMNKSDIHSLKNGGEEKNARDASFSRTKTMTSASSTTNIHGSTLVAPGRKNRDQWAETSNRSGRASHVRSISGLSHTARDQWAK